MPIGTAEMPWNAPEVATRMNSGMTSDGMNTAGMRRTRISARQASIAGHRRGAAKVDALTRHPPGGVAG